MGADDKFVVSESIAKLNPGQTTFSDFTGRKWWSVPGFEIRDRPRFLISPAGNGGLSLVLIVKSGDRNYWRFGAARCLSVSAPDVVLPCLQ
jgi:hypothetical protein